MRRPATRSLGSIVLLAAHLVACTEWHVEQARPQALLDAGHPTRVRVPRSDSTRIVLAQPAILGDSLVGQLQGHSAGVAVADIASLAVRRTNAVNTLLLIGGVVLLAVGASAVGNSMGEIGFGSGGMY